MKRVGLLLSLFSATSLLAADVTGVFEPGQAYRQPERNAPASVSRMFVRNLDAAAIRQGVDLPATGGGGMIIVVSADGVRVPATLRTPTGDALVPSDRGSKQRGMQRVVVDDVASREVIHVDRTEAGAYRLTDIELPAGSRGAVVIAAEPDSRLTLTTTAGPLSRNAGDAVTLRAELRDDAAAIAGARVLARLVPPGGEPGEAIVLADRGDGVYTAVVSDLPSHVSGFWTIRYDAEGTTPRGVAFARSGSAQIMNERPSARLGNIRATVDGDTLRVTAAADVTQRGRYRFDVIAASPADGSGERRGVAWGEAERALELGASELTIAIPLHGASADGLFLDVRLLTLDTMGVADRQTATVAGEGGREGAAPGIEVMKRVAARDRVD
jgi:hypothetical protein